MSALARQLAASGEYAASSSDPRIEADWLNANGARVALLQRRLAQAILVHLVGPGPSLAAIEQVMESLGWTARDVRVYGVQGDEIVSDPRAIRQAEESETRFRVDNGSSHDGSLR